MFSIFVVTIVFVFVVGVLALVAYAIYECTPLPHRTNPYRDSDTGRRLWSSPDLEDRRRGAE